MMKASVLLVSSLLSVISVSRGFAFLPTSSKISTSSSPRQQHQQHNHVALQTNRRAHRHVSAITSRDARSRRLDPVCRDTLDSLPMSRISSTRLTASPPGVDGEDSGEASSALPESIAIKPALASADEAGEGKESPGAGVGGTVDLAKGIAFEAPKAKREEVEEEEESKKIRVILYTVLSLVPFLLLLPFLGDRDFIPLDPGQM